MAERLDVTLLKYCKSRKKEQGSALTFIRNKEIGEDVYAVCDVVNILYITNQLHLSTGEKKDFAQAIQRFQNPRTGQFEKSDHRSDYHSTAMAVSALKLLGEEPRFPLSYMSELKQDWTMLERWLSERDWTHNPWNGSGHDIPAVMSIFLNLEEVKKEWFYGVLEWLNQKQDAETGMWPKGIKNSIHIMHLGAAFHFYFIYEYLHQPIHFSERIIDSVLFLQKDCGSWFDSWPAGFIDLDASFTLARMSRFSHQLRQVCEEAMKKNARYTIDRLHSKEDLMKLFEDTHQTLGTVANLASLQEVLPAHNVSDIDLKQVLDFSPFI